MLEAMVMLDERIEKKTIDAAAEKFGMPMGPIELADQVGLVFSSRLATCRARNSAISSADTGLASRQGHERRTRPQDRQGVLRLEGRPGGEGDTSSAVQPTQEMIDRLVLPMSNVCVACLREGIVDNPDTVDGAERPSAPAMRRFAAVP